MCILKSSSRLLDSSIIFCISGQKNFCYLHYPLSNRYCPFQTSLHLMNYFAFSSSSSFKFLIIIVNPTFKYSFCSRFIFYKTNSKSCWSPLLLGFYGIIAHVDTLFFIFQRSCHLYSIHFFLMKEVNDKIRHHSNYYNLNK